MTESLDNLQKVSEALAKVFQLAEHLDVKSIKIIQLAAEIYAEEQLDLLVDEEILDDLYQVPELAIERSKRNHPANSQPSKKKREFKQTEVVVQGPWVYNDDNEGDTA